MLKPDKMELHLKIHMVIILRNILKILWVKKTIMQILQENNNANFAIDFYMKLLFPQVSECKYLYLKFNH